MIDEHPAIAVTVYLTGVIVTMAVMMARIKSRNDGDDVFCALVAMTWPIFVAIIIAALPVLVGHAIGKRFIHD